MVAICALIVKAAVEKTAYHFDRLFDYAVPFQLRDSVKKGCRVLVPFGQGNDQRQAMVFDVESAAEPPEKLKPVLRVLDDAPVLGDELLRLALWMHEQYFCTCFDAAKAMLPTGLDMKTVRCYVPGEDMTLERLDAIEGLADIERLAATTVICSAEPVERSRLLEMYGLDEDSDLPERLIRKGIIARSDDAVRRTGDATVRMVRLCDSYERCCDGKLTPKQKRVVELLEQTGSASVKEICAFCGVTKVILTNLKKRGVVEYFDNEVFRRPRNASSSVTDTGAISLTPQQQTAYENISRRYHSGEFSTTLLYGVTGSGKTSVFMRAIDDAVADGRGVIVMVPEISLTPQTLQRFRSRYGDRIAVFHSALSMGQRLDEWKRVRRGEAAIAIGTRSAVFAPFDNIGLIVMDEEQEYTYKSESNPRYHARNVARFRCAYHKASLLLASATPSIESYYMAAEAGSYHLEQLTQRFGDARLPVVDTVDISEQKPSDSLFSPQLRQALEYNLEKGYQSILLHNRRGFNTFVACRSCGKVLTCEQCSVSMTYHLNSNRLLCHYCGRSSAFVTRCPECGSEQLRYAGQGTQRVEDELARLFPEARVLRMDADSTQQKFSHADKLASFERGDYDIMIGTQMVAKGLDFERVTLVGVMLADQMLYSDDFRSYERAFSLLTQVVGRSGRGEFSGRAIIQTMTPENPVIAMAARQDYLQFYSNEVTVRRAMLYPPFSDICMVGFVGATEDMVRKMAFCFTDMLRERAQKDYPELPLRVLGPAPASVTRVKGKVRYRLLIKCRNSARFREMLSTLLREIGQSRAFGSTNAFADMNPDNIL